MGLFDTIKNKYSEHIQQRNDMCNNLIADTSTAIDNHKQLFSDSDSFINLEIAKKWLNENKSLLSQITNIRKFKKAESFNKLSGADEGT